MDIHQDDIEQPQNSLKPGNEIHPKETPNHFDPKSEHDGLPEEKTALVIRIQSWATPVVGLVMLLFGLLIGYFGHPLISPPEETSVIPIAALPTHAETATEAPTPYEPPEERPTLEKLTTSEPTPSRSPTSHPTETSTASSAISPSSSPTGLPTVDAEEAARKEAFQNAVVSQTRHFKGNPDAPIVMIEFSDFQ